MLSASRPGVHPAAHGTQRFAVRERARLLRRPAAQTSRCWSAAQGERAARAGDPGDGRQSGRHVGRLLAARRGRLRALLRGHAPAPGGARQIRLRLVLSPTVRRFRDRAAVASPGCFATTRIQLGLLPLARAGMLSGVVHVVGTTGSSGSGIVLSCGDRSGARGQPQRRTRCSSTSTRPKIRRRTSASRPRAPGCSGPSFRSPGCCRAGSGCTSFVELPVEDRRSCRRASSTTTPTPPSPSSASARDRLPEVAAVAAGHAEVGFTLGALEGVSRTPAIVSATDNLIKGGAGQRIQNMVTPGPPETASLEDRLWP